jgi:predicted DsbA family dithiol-disulfide isomerase/uncharacterized membrane protein
MIAPVPRSDSRLVPVLALIAALAGAAASAAALADWLAPEPAFCAASGCATVRASAWSRPLGVPLPVLGLTFFTVAAALVVVGDRLRLARRVIAAAGGLGALGLIAVQAFVIGAWCNLCLVADLAAVLFALLAWAPRVSWPRASGGLHALAGGAVVLAVAVPMLVGRGGAPEMVAPKGAMPEVVAAEQRPGEVVIVDFIDFQCPHCRNFHGRLVAALDKADLKVPVRVVRKMVPLPIHEYALTAAIAWCCADAQGKGDEMADALIKAPVEALTAPGCEKIAVEVGLDLAQYRKDAASPEIKARVEADLAAAKAAGLRSLPTVYVNDHAFVGAAATVDDIVAALRKAGANAELHL